MVELSYRDVEASLSRATDFSPGHIIIQVERDVTQEYMLKVPYFATYEVSAVAISKACLLYTSISGSSGITVWCRFKC